MKISLSYLFFGLIVGFLLFVRIINLGQNPVSLYWDELAIGIDAYSLAKIGLDIHGHNWLQAIFLSYGDYKAPVAIWLVSLSVRLFSLTPFAVRLPFALVWLSSVPVFYLLLKQLLPKNKINTLVLNLSLVLFLATPWHFHFARIGFESGLSFCFLLWAVLFTFWGFSKKSFWLIPASLFGLISVYSYFSARYVVPVFLGIIILVYWKQLWQKKIYLLLAVFIFVLGLLPLYLSPYYQASQQYRLSTPSILNSNQALSESANLIEQSGNSLAARLFYHRYFFIARELLNNYLPYFSIDFLFLQGDPNLRHHSGWGGQLLAITAIPLLFGLYWLFKNWKSKTTIILIICLLVAPITAALPYEPYHASRSIYMLLPLMGIAALGFGQLLAQLPNRLSNLAFLLLLLAIALNSLLYLEDYFIHYPARSAQAWQLGNTYIGQAVAEYKNDYDHIFVDSAYWQPALAVVFYNPKLIVDIQEHGNNNDWVKQIGKISFGLDETKQPEDHSLYLSSKKLSGKIIQNYVFPDGSEALYAISR
ncbi:hypothetical protein GYA49_05310 [Candidatus Beckwithbacteria bacterium]|nr:hypothetical protein [Candidatus Beckwithbacteria bacterium]